MPAVIHNAPACLIPKELFKEEKIQEYWNVLYPNPQNISIRKNDLGDYCLLYPNLSEEDSIHNICLMNNKLQTKYSNFTNAICISVDVESFNLLAIKDKDIVCARNFQFTANEDILYQMANIYQHFFENISQVVFFYQQLSPKILRLLSKYYKMKKI